MSQTTDLSERFKQRLRIGDYIVDPGALSVQHGDRTAKLKPKAMAVLVELARQPGITLTRDELLDRVWANAYITPGVVGHAVTAIRRAFDDAIGTPAYVETIPRIGYRLIATVEAIADTDPQQTAPPVFASPADSPGNPESSGWLPKVWWGSLAAGVLLALLLAFIRFTGEKDKPTLDIREQRRITFATGSETNPRLNTGGDWLVYLSRAPERVTPDLLLQSAYGTRARVLAGGQTERPVWSPEGRRIAYVWHSDQHCELRILGVDDAAQEKALSCRPHSQLYFDWNPSDPQTIVYATLIQGQMGGSQLSLLVNDGGWRTRKFSYARERDYVDLDPRFSPDGARIAFRRGGNPTSDLYVVASTGGAVRRLTELRTRISGFDWLPDGSGIVFSSDHLGQQDLYWLDIDSGQIRHLALTNASYPDIALRGWYMTYQLEGWRSALVEIGIPQGRALGPPLTSSSGRDRSASLSPDDAQVAFVSDRDGGRQLWLLDRKGGGLRRMTNHPSLNVDAPSWSPDGRFILYETRGVGEQALWELQVSTGTSRRLTTGKTAMRNAVYAGDGHSAYYIAWNDHAWRLHRCVRREHLQDCNGRRTGHQAWRVDRAQFDGAPALVLSSPSRSGEIDIVDEKTLAVRKRMRLPVNDGWSVVGEEIWFLQNQAPERGDGIVNVRALAFDTGAQREISQIAGLRHLRYSPPMVTRDRGTLLIPAITEDVTDVAFARLVLANTPN